MNLNDPIGDMITRIRNAQSRTKPKVSTPGSKLRQQRARGAQERRLYPRLFDASSTATAAPSSRSSSNISTARR